MRVYVTQYGCWWSLSVKEWCGLVREGLKGEGYTLPSQRELAARPACIHPYFRGADRDFYVASGARARLVKPLDWDADDFRYEMEELQQQGLWK